jgi:nitroimidazol reductase NimA-like FMN-containing flavoprotein (pyridoxamine 5'-phosphate oxidase superfamily)
VDSAALKQATAESFAVYAHTKVKRLPKRGAYDRATVHSILDAGMLCAVSYCAGGDAAAIMRRGGCPAHSPEKTTTTQAEGKGDAAEKEEDEEAQQQQGDDDDDDDEDTKTSYPVCLTTGYCRDGESILLHGKATSQLMRHMERGGLVSVSVTEVNALILARSAFHHSMNYRSVCIFGAAALITDKAEKIAAFKTYTNSIVPNRWDSLRMVTDAELKSTSIVRLPLRYVSAKTRTGGASDDKADMALGIWAGVIPLSLRAGAPIPDKLMTAPVPRMPQHVSEFTRVAKLPLVAKQKQGFSLLTVLMLLGVIAALAAKLYIVMEK